LAVLWPDDSTPCPGSTTLGIDKTSAETAERNHQGIGNLLIVSGEEVGRTTGKIACRERLGGILRYYYREAA